MNTVFIYALKCPNTNEIRYIGKTKNPKARLASHLVGNGKNHRGCWIRSVLATGEKPILEIIDEVPELEWPSWEVAYIQFFREEGCNLVNSTCGGEGVEMTGETLAKMCASHVGMQGKQHSLETKAKMSAAKSGENCSVETRTKLSASKAGEKNPNFGKIFSPETRAKMSIFMRGERNPNFGKKLSLEHRAKISVAKLGKKHSPETKAKMHESYWARRKGVAL